MRFFLHLTRFIPLYPFILLVALFLVSISCKLNHNHDFAETTKLYAEGLQVTYDRNNPYCPEAEIAFADSMLAIPTNSPRIIVITKFIKGFALLKLGEEQKAINILGEVVDNLSGNPEDKLYKEAENYLAVAYLRLGERNNCIANHGMSSCIFPIQGNGIYTDSSATLKSIQVYKQLLADNPGD